VLLVLSVIGFVIVCLGNLCLLVFGFVLVVLPCFALVLGVYICLRSLCFCGFLWGCALIVLRLCVICSLQFAWFG